MGMFGPRKGCWYIRSESDERWNASGECCIYSVFEIPDVCHKKLQELELKYGEPPEDLVVGQHKY